MNTVAIFQTSGDEVEQLKKNKGKTLETVHVRMGGSVLTFNDSPPVTNDSPDVLTSEEQNAVLEAAAECAELGIDCGPFEAVVNMLSRRVMANTYKKKLPQG